MPTYQTPLPKSRTLYTKGVRALLYPCLEDRGKGVVVSYQGDRRRPNRRYLYAADELGYRRQQSYVHDIIVNIAVGGRRYRFRVFFKRHKALPENQAIKALPGATVTFDGDVVLAAIGPRVAIRNMGPRAERAAADIAICKLARRLGPFRTRRRYPSEVYL